MIREIVKKGDKILTKTCHPVTRFDWRLGRLLDDLRETLLDSGGVGLAAPQIGICRRVVVMMNEAEEIHELVNPEIVASSGEQEDFEGCLSLPGKYGLVKRPMTVRVRAQDRKGNWFEVEDSGLTARCFCHELAHLDGHMFDELCDRLYSSEEVDEYRAAHEAQQDQTED
ncbi:MAG: peptide deformylase [Clostridiales bacterium]|nr:peptide deformylase [Clostridiales bacterium]